MYRLLALQLLSMAVVASLPATTNAQVQSPTIKPGLWNIPETVEGMKVVHQVCRDGTEGPRFTLEPLPPITKRGRTCTEIGRKRVANGYWTEGVCVGRGPTGHIYTTISGDPQSRYVVELSKRGDTGPTMTISTTYEWVGACPAGMKPGQEVFKMYPSSGRTLDTH
jgi:hypothetical protein